MGVFGLAWPGTFSLESWSAAAGALPWGVGWVGAAGHEALFERTGARAQRQAPMLLDVLYASITPPQAATAKGAASARRHASGGLRRITPPQRAASGGSPPAASRGWAPH